MGNYTSSFLKENDHLNHFNVKAVPTFSEISKEILDLKFKEDVDYLHKLFERCCFLKLIDFFDRYSDKKNGIQCNSKMTEFVLDSNTSTAAWFFHCKDCTKAEEETCFCVECFLSNDYHIENNHSFNLIIYPSATCDCGNSNLIKPEGFCKKHSCKGAAIDSYDSLPLFLKKDLHIFFRYILSHLTTSNISLAVTKKNKVLNGIIIDWLVEVAEKSNVIEKILIEEMFGKILFDGKVKENNGKSVVEIYPFTDKELTQCNVAHGYFIEFFLKNLVSNEFSNSFLPLLTVLMENGEIIKFEFLNLFLKYYSKIFKSEDKYSNAFLKKVHIFYQGFHHITEQFALRDKENIIEIILTCYLEFFKQKKRVFPKFSQYDFNIDISFWFSYLITTKVVSYILEHKPILIDLYSNILLQLHGYSTETSCDFKELGPIFVATFEDVFTIQFQLIISSIKEITKDNKEQEIKYVGILLNSIMKHIESIQKEPLYERKNTTLLLPRMESGESMSCSDIVIYCSLFRLMGSILMNDPDNYIPLIKPRLTNDILVNMVDDLFIFLCVYLSYESDPYPSKNIFIDLGVYMTYTFNLQLAHSILGTNYFMLTIFNSLSSLISYQANAYERPFRILISLLDKNINYQITEEDLKYHLSNWIMTKTFPSWINVQEVLSHAYPIFYKTHYQYEEHITMAKKVFKECIVDDNFLKLNPDMLCYFDSYYPFYTQADKTSLFSFAFEEYSLTTNSIQVSSPPKSTKLLPKEMGGFYRIFLDSMLYDIMHLTLTFQCFKDQEFKLLDRSYISEIFEKMVGCPDYLSKEIIYMIHIALHKHKLLLDNNQIDNSISSKIKENIKEFLNNVMPDIQKFNKKTSSPDQLDQDEEMKLLNDRIDQLFPNDSCIIYNIIKPKRIKFTSKSTNSKQQITYKYLSILDLLYQVSTQSFIKNVDILYEYYKQMDEIIGTLKSIDESLEIYINLKADEFNNNDQENQNNNNNNNNNNDSNSKIQSHKHDHVYNNDVNELKINYPNFYQIANYELLNDSHYCNIDENECIICKCTDEKDPLLLISHINFTSVLEQNTLQHIKNFVYEETHNSRNVGFLEKFYKSELNLKVEYLPDRFDFFQLYCIYLFNRTYSTTLKSCGHKIHSKCFSTSIHDKNDFNCPECKTRANTLIPIVSSKKNENGESIDHSNEIYNDFYLNMTKLYFLPFVIDVNFTVLERFLWKAVLKNIELIELKSRLCQNYKLNDDKDKDGYYIFKSNEEFRFNLKASKILYDTIQRCRVTYSPTEPLPIRDPLIFLADVFTSASYSHYITKSVSPLEFSKQAIELELFKMIIHHIINNTSEILLSQKDLTFQVLKPHIEHLIKNQLPSDLVITFHDQIYPLLRKFYILETINDGTNIDSTSLEDLSNFDYISNHFQFKLEDFVKSLDYIPLLHDFLNVTSTPSGLQVYGVYPVPIGYKNLPKFIDLPDTHYQLIKENYAEKCEHCQKIQVELCLVCGIRICLDPACQITLTNHWFQCPATNSAYFLQLNSPALKVAQKTITIATTKTHMIYSDPNRNTLEDTLYNQQIPLTKNLVLDKKNLKEIYLEFFN